MEVKQTYLTSNVIYDNLIRIIVLYSSSTNRDIFENLLLMYCSFKIILPLAIELY